MSDYPELTTAEGPILSDKKLFRIGAIAVWAEVKTENGYDKIAVHDVQLNFGLAGIPSASALLGVGLPFGPYADQYQEIQATVGTIDRGTEVQLKIRVLEQTSDDNSFLGQMLASGDYLLFDGVVGAVKVETSDDSSDIGLSVSLTHKTGLLMASNTTIFGKFAPGSLDLSTASGILDAQLGATPATDGESVDMWTSWIVKNLTEVLTPNALYLNRPNNLLQSTFSGYDDTQLQNFNEAVANTVGELTVRSDSSISEASRYDISQHIGGYLIRGSKSTNALNLLTQLGEDMLFSIMGLADKLYVFPYWPYRKVSEMLALRAGSFVTSRHVDSTLMTRGALLGGVAITAPAISDVTAGKSVVKPAYQGAYKWKGFTAQEKTYATVDAVRAPTWLLQSYQPSAAEKLEAGSYSKAKPVHAPGAVSTDEKVKPQEPIYTGVLDKFARFLTLEGLMKGDVLDISTPLRFDIVPGKVLRLDQASAGQAGTVAQADALYGHVQSVMVRISAISGAAGVQSRISHVHNYADQQEIESDEDGPIVYQTTYYDTLNSLQLVVPA